MSDTHIIIGCLITVGFALFAVSYINSMQTRKRLIRQRLTQLKRKVSEMEELASALGSLVDSPDIEKVVLEEILDTLRGMKQISTDNHSLAFNIESILNRLQELNLPDYQATLHRAFESDAQVAKARFQLSEAGRIVRKRQASGFLELPQMNIMIEELAWAHLMVLVITLTSQGHKAFEQGDVLRAYSFYKKAQETAMKTNISDERRHKLIKELGEMQSGNRKTLSVELMSEPQLNDNDTHSPDAV